MTRTKKILLGILSFFPIVYIFAFVGFMFAFMASMFADPAAAGEPTFFMGFFALHFLAIISILGLTVYYIILAVKDKSLTENERLIWILVLVFANMIAFPVMWYKLIWTKDEQQQIEEELI